LTQNGDRFCTVCHANLAEHFADGVDRSTVRLANSRISHWADHPPFDLPKSDPGKLKFNHKLHLSPGMAREGGMPLKTDSAGPVQLNCASCHQPNESTRGTMKPIAYEAHCQACHPLTVKLPEDARELQIPHGWQPNKLHELIQGLLVSRALENKKETLQRPPWQLPGKDEAFKLTIADRLAAVERDLIGSKKLCNECHTFAGEAGKGALADLKIDAIEVPVVWYKQAKFNHTSHRMLECRECHAAAESSTSAATVAIPNIDNCQKCHGSAGGVRADCVECHTYHNGDHPLAGKGAPQRAPAKRELKEFLKPNN
jgi:hypothetical protein